MDSESLPLLTAMKQRLAWLGQRQKVLAENIAQADTPGYRPLDLAKPTFRELVNGSQHLTMAATSPEHFSGGQAEKGPFTERPSDSVYETAPAGNAVVLEEQMAKVNETAVDHRLTTQLYRKYLGLIKIAAGSRQ